METTDEAAVTFPSPTPGLQAPASGTKVRSDSSSKRVARKDRKEQRSARKKIFSFTIPTKSRPKYNSAARFQRGSSDEESDTDAGKESQGREREHKPTSAPSSPALSEQERLSLWKRCSRGAATRKRVGAADVAMPVDSRIHTILQLVPVSEFCATLYKSKQSINATVPKASVAFQTTYPGTVARIVKTTILVGQAARVEIDAAEAEISW